MSATPSLPSTDTRDARGATIPAGHAGEMRALVRDFDWGTTLLGPTSEWPISLRTIADLVLGSEIPMILLWGPELTQLYNEGYRQVIGVKHPRALGMATRECWPEVWHINGPVYERVLAGESVYFEDAVYPLLRAGVAEDVYLTISYSPVRDDVGAVAGVLVTLIETTARVRTQRMEAERETLLRELEVERARLEEVFRGAPSFMAIIRGPDHVFQLANDPYLQLVGKRDIIGRRVADAVPEVVEQGFIPILDHVLETGEPFVGRETPIMLEREGVLEQRYLDFVYQPLTEADGTRVGIVAHGSDVTEQAEARHEVERVNAELERSSAELRASERRLRDVFNQAPMAVAVLTGSEHVYTIVSPRYVETPGGGRQLLGRSVREAFPELEGQGFLEIMDRVYTSGKPYFHAERRVMLDRDGDGMAEEYFYNVGYQPLRNADGDVYALASVAYEVTEHVRARRELEAAREVAEAARLDAELANRAKSSFLATMSHELRTPLNAVAGYADLLLLGVRGDLQPGQREDVERIRRSGQYLLGLINDVLNFAKLDAGQVEYRMERVQIAPLLRGLEELIRPQVDAKGVRYAHGSCSDEYAVMADAEKLRQIVLNLLANAVKFTDAGGEVALTCQDGGSEVKISVRDTGRGIAASQLSRVFDPFVQVDRHLTPTSQQGVGLGLAISRDLAAGMGGRLEASSDEGAGSEFVLVLPRA